MEVFDTSIAGHHAVSASVGLAMLFAMVAPVYGLPVAVLVRVDGAGALVYGNRRDKARRALVSSTMARPVPQAT